MPSSPHILLPEEGLWLRWGWCCEQLPRFWGLCVILGSGGISCRAELKVTCLRVFCGNLRFFCSLLHPPNAWNQNFQKMGWICENLRFSAKICVLGSLCHHRSVTLSAPWSCTIAQWYVRPTAKFGNSRPCFSDLGHTPSTAGNSRKKFRKLLERPRKRSQSVSWNSPREYGWDAPNPIIQGNWGFQSISRIGSREGLSELVLEFPAVLRHFWWSGV